MLKLLICFICLILPLSLKAEANKILNLFNKNIYTDITLEIKNSEYISTINLNDDIYDFSVVAADHSLKYIYTTKQKPSLLNISSYFGNRYQSKITSVKLPEPFIGTEYTAVKFPAGKGAGILLSTKSGAIQGAVSYDDGNSWTESPLGDYITCSPILYVNRSNQHEYIAYFIGRGDLTTLNSSDRAMIYRISSTDMGKTWSNPVIAVKHNLHSLTSATFFHRTNRIGEESDVVYAIFSCNENGNVYYSISHDGGINWRYPLEIHTLQGTTNHKISAHKDRAILLYTKSYSDKEGKKDAVFLFTSSARQFESGRFKGDLYRIYEYTPKMKSLLDSGYNFVDAIIYRSKHVVFSIASDWDGKEVYIKSILLNLN